MNCPKCDNLMHNYDDMNFLCPYCYSIVYRESETRERYLLNRGHKTCPVCSRIAVKDDGGYVCLICVARIDMRSKNLVEISPAVLQTLPTYRTKKIPKKISTYNKKKKISVSLIFSIIVVSILLLGSTISVIVDADVSENDAYFLSDPLFDDINQPVNLNNASYTDTVISEWEVDLGDDMPLGTYYGSLLSPALFEHNIRPTFVSGVRYTAVILSGHFRFDAQTIMSGASEWWVRLPFNPDVMASKGILCVFKNCDNSSLIGFDDDFVYYENQYDFLRPSNQGQMPYDFIPYKLQGTTRRGEGHIVNDRMYLKVHSILRPNVDYVISYAFWMREDGILQTYWSTGEQVCGGWSSIAVAEIGLEPSFNDTRTVDILDTQRIDVPLDMDWSFIFTEGIGYGGLFGYNLNLDVMGSMQPVYDGEEIIGYYYATRNESLTLYPFMNISDEEQYMSFMLPFISEDSVWCKPAVYNGLVPLVTSGLHIWWFGELISGPPPIPNDDRFVPEYGYEYYDFILFSTNQTIVTQGAFMGFFPQDRYNVRATFTFNVSIDITLLCHERDDTPVNWDDFHLFWTGIEYSIDHYANRSRNPYMRPWVREYEGDDYNSTTKIDYYLGYEIWCSARGTDGQWFQQQTDAASGDMIYTYHFPQVMSLPPGNYRLVGNDSADEEILEEWEILWALAQDEWGAKRYLSAIRYAFMSAITRVWDGGVAIIGWLKDGLSEVWRLMVSFGSFIYTKIVEFVGKIYNFLQEVGDHLVTFWGSLKHAVAPMMMVTIIAFSTRFAKTARRDGE